MSSGKVILGVLAGVAVGAAAGILFAPEKGSKTRRKILRKSQDSLEDLKEKFDDLLDNFSEKFEDTRHEIEAMMSKGKSKYEEAKKEAKV